MLHKILIKNQIFIEEYFIHKSGNLEIYIGLGN